VELVYAVANEYVQAEASVIVPPLLASALTIAASSPAVPPPDPLQGTVTLTPAADATAPVPSAVIKETAATMATTTCRRRSPGPHGNGAVDRV
jgi:hypothetical protein